MIECRTPKTKKEFEKYYKLRWEILRKPWQQPLGSEQDNLEDQGIHRCIIDEQDTMLAIGRLHFNDQFTAQIRYMAVSNEAQGKGYGAILLESLEHEAKLRGAKRVVLKAREVALAFYQKNHYESFGLAHLLYNDIQHYSMEKELNTFSNHQSENSQELQNTWHNTIPLSKAMNIVLCYFDGLKLITSCETTFNKNLHNTMFAGSIYTLATLTGWGWVYLLLNKDNCHGDIVLADAKIKYLAPIAGVVSAKTQHNLAVGDTSLLDKNNKTRFIINVDVYSGDKVAAKFTGEYVVIKKDNNQC